MRAAAAGLGLGRELRWLLAPSRVSKIGGNPADRFMNRFRPQNRTYKFVRTVSRPVSPVKRPGFSLYGNRSAGGFVNPGPVTPASCADHELSLGAAEPVASSMRAVGRGRPESQLTRLIIKPEEKTTSKN